MILFNQVLYLCTENKPKGNSNDGNSTHQKDLKRAHCETTMTTNASESKKRSFGTECGGHDHAEAHEYFSEEEDFQVASDGSSEMNYKMTTNVTVDIDDFQIADDVDNIVHVEKRYRVCRTKNTTTDGEGQDVILEPKESDDGVYDFHSDDSSLCSFDSEFEIADELPLEQEEETATRSNCCDLRCRDRSLPVGCKEALANIAMMKSKIEVKNELLGHLRGQQRMDLSTFRLFFGGDYMCDQFFSEISGVSLYIIGQVKDDFAAGRIRYEHGNAGNFQSSTAATGFLCWMKSFAELYGQSAPDEEVYVLPSFLAVKDLFEIYENEVEEPRIKISTFYSLFKKYFASNRADKTHPHIRLSAWSTHSKCDQCICLSRYRRSSRTEESLKHAKSLQLAHKTCYGRARIHIESLRHLALSYPDSRLFIQIDDMGRLICLCFCVQAQSKSGLVHLQVLLLIY